MHTPSPAIGSADPRTLYQAACDHARRTAVLASVESLLGWDEQTKLPTAAGAHRAEQVGAVAALVHASRTDRAQGERLERLAESELARTGTEEEQGSIRRLHRDYQKQVRLPARLVEETARVCIDGQQAWVVARRESDWSRMAPWLERIFALKREQAACQLPALDPYDSLLDDYEPGALSSDVAAVFDRLRPKIVELVQACTSSAIRPDDAVLRRQYPLAAQERFVREVASRIGFDFSRGRLDTSTHPFCSTAGPHDCRLTTRWDENFLPTSLFGVLHEAGHGLYEQGLPDGAYGLPGGEAASLGVHESQSRLWENLVGRSSEFWAWCFPLAREAFPDALSQSSAAEVQRALLTVRPSLIRVEADEVTYNLHIMMRFDLERSVIRGDLAVADLPEAWNARFERDFGIRPPSDAEGGLQDIHWSAGLIGYFPTYTMGNIFAAQLMAAAERTMPGLRNDLASGRFAGLLQWLRERVHSSGRLRDPQALVTAATGEAVSERWLLESLWHRYGPPHGLAR